MKIAVVGTGISGMVAAWKLHPEHDVAVFEAGSYIGGHTNTIDVEEDGRSVPVDTGFIVFNEKTYPNFVNILRQIGVAYKPSSMSFSVRNEESGLEYNGTSLNTLFAQRRNLFSPSFWRMTRDILRFYREAGELLEDGNEDVTLGDYLRRGAYSTEFVEDHILPMAAAVWSSSPATMDQFPARFLVRFFHNHGFLQVNERPEWLVISGGSREYVKKLTAPYRDRIRLQTPVQSIRRLDGGVELSLPGGEIEAFDRVVLATHSDQALRLLADPSLEEQEILTAFPYQENEAVLHTDRSLLPRKKLARASWNYHVTEEANELVTVTYWMNHLQGLDARRDYLVTLNRTEAIDPAGVIRTIKYDHPVFNSASVRAQARHGEIDGVNATHFCGAYWGNGFHEDGVRSALAVCENLERRPNHVSK